MEQTEARFERELILKALQDANGDLTRAAKRLDIAPGNLQMKVTEYQLFDQVKS
jgi:DNA-binding NtrC family response regulator